MKRWNSFLRNAQPLKTLLTRAALLPAAFSRDGMKGDPLLDLPAGISNGVKAISLCPSGSREASEALWGGGGDSMESRGTGK